jgi:hypothetical protein
MKLDIEANSPMAVHAHHDKRVIDPFIELSPEIQIIASPYICTRLMSNHNLREQQPRRSSQFALLYLIPSLSAFVLDPFPATKQRRF